MTFLLIILHFAAVLSAAAARRRGHLHFPAAMLPAVLLLPFWGIAFAVVTGLHIRGGEKADAEPGRGWSGITDEVYRSIRRDKDDMSGALPIRDVLENRSPVRRRSLLLSVLHEGAAPFAGALRKAGLNDDTEVVHYAVTALTELRSEYEQNIARMEELYRRYPSSLQVMQDYADLDEEYLRSKIPDSIESAERIEHCRRMLEKLLNCIAWQQTGSKSAASSGDREKAAKRTELHHRTVVLLRRLGDICLLQGDTEAAEEAGRRLLKEIPDREDGYMLILKARAAARDRGGVERVISTVRSSGIYLSPAAREQIRFWSA